MIMMVVVVGMTERGFPMTTSIHRVISMFTAVLNALSILTCLTINKIHLGQILFILYYINEETNTQRG